MSQGPAATEATADQQILAADVRSVLREIPDYPIPGVVFKDFTPLLADPALSARVVHHVAGRHHDRVDRVVGIEARGFILGAAIAHHLGVGFVPVRKADKLPAARHSIDYELEYGSATLEMHVDAVGRGERVLVIDDVLATGGTAAATCELIDRCGGEVVAVDVILELTFLHGRDKLPQIPVHALICD